MSECCRRQSKQTVIHVTGEDVVDVDDILSRIERYLNYSYNAVTNRRGAYLDVWPNTL